MPVQALLWILVTAVAGAPAASEDPLLGRAAEYVAAFERTFAAVTWRERYEQEDRQRGRFSSSGSVGMRLEGTRQLESQLLFVFLPNDATWVAVRDVIAV